MSINCAESHTGIIMAKLRQLSITTCFLNKNLPNTQMDAKYIVSVGGLQTRSGTLIVRLTILMQYLFYIKETAAAFAPDAPALRLSLCTTALAPR